MSRPRRLYIDSKTRKPYYLISGKKVYIKVPNKISMKQLQKVNIRNIINVAQPKRVRRKNKKIKGVYQRKISSQMKKGDKVSSITENMGLPTYIFEEQKKIPELATAGRKPVMTQGLVNLPIQSPIPFGIPMAQPYIIPEPKNVTPIKPERTPVFTSPDYNVFTSPFSETPLPKTSFSSPENENFKNIVESFAKLKIEQPEQPFAITPEKELAYFNKPGTTLKLPSLTPIPEKQRIKEVNAEKLRQREEEYQSAREEVFQSAKKPTNRKLEIPRRAATNEQLKRESDVNKLVQKFYSTDTEKIQFGKKTYSAFENWFRTDTSKTRIKFSEKYEQFPTLIEFENSPSFKGFGYDGNDEDDGLFNDEIEKITKKRFRHFVPCIAADQTNELLQYVKHGDKEFAFVINTNPSKSDGSGKDGFRPGHWTAIFIDNRDDFPSCEFFDPLAEGLPPIAVIRIMRKLCLKMNNEKMFKYKHNLLRRQSYKNSNCGFHCIKYLEDRINCIPFSEASGYDEYFKDHKGLDGSEDAEKELKPMMRKYNSYL